METKPPWTHCSSVVPSCVYTKARRRLLCSRRSLPSSFVRSFLQSVALVSDAYVRVRVTPRWLHLTVRNLKFFTIVVKQARFGTLRYIPGAVSNIPALGCYLDARPALCVSNIPALGYYLAKVKVSEMNRFNSFQTQSSLGRYAHLWYKATPTYFCTENSNAFYGTHLSTQHPTTNQHERTRRRRRGKRRLLWRHQ